MEKYANKIAIVTGSSCGIGAAISRELVKHGVIVVGIARRIEKLKQLSDELNGTNAGKFHPLKCDITNESEIKNSFEWVTSKLGPISILVNNAAVLNPAPLLETTGEMISQLFDTNVKASILCSQLAVQNMTSNSNQGHIVNINSIAGHLILSYNPNLMQVYSFSKHAQKVFSEALRRELINKKTHIKVTNLSPGVVVTEMLESYDRSMLEYPPEKLLQAKDIADGCIYALSTPFNVTVSELTILPLHQEV